MARISSIFLAALGVFQPARAFTNGSLIPSYFCNPIPDGLPKSLGELIPFTVKDTDQLAFNKIAGDNLNKVPMTNSTPGNTGYMLASFHNTANSILPIIPGIGVTLANNTTKLIAGQANALVLKSLKPGMDVLGVLIHAVFSGTHTPAGFFTDAGGMFVPFPGCGVASTGEINGLVHKTTICQQTYTGLSYHAPAFAANTSILIFGLSVTDYGFGVWNLTLQLAEATAIAPTSAHMATPTMMPTMNMTKMGTPTMMPTMNMTKMGTPTMMSSMNMSHMPGASMTGPVVSSGASGRARGLLRFWWR